MELYQVAFFTNYAVAAGVVNHVLLPRFFYPKKYGRFVLGLLVIITGVVLVEELLLEQIYFPDTRGASFPGVFVTLLGLLPPIFVLTGFQFAWDALTKQRELERLQAAMQDSELQYLKSQINPHFLFNNLNNLYSYAIENSPRTPDIILELSGVLRYMLYECREKYVPLTKEIKHLENFVKISEMQIEERGQVDFTTEGIRAGFRIAPLILSVFVENAFKHSTASQSEQILVQVQVSLSESGVLDFRVANTFRPQANTASLNRGIGLENVRKRLQLLYPGAHDLHIGQEAGQYRVHLILNLEKITDA